MNRDPSNIILTGHWLYDGSVKLKVQITETNFKPGSGDFLDPEDIRNDQFGKYYNILQYSHEDKLVSEIQGLETLEKAKELAENNCQSLTWSS